MTELAAAAEQFAEGSLVLVGDESDKTIFVATLADQIRPERLEQLQALGRGMVVLGLDQMVASRLALAEHRPVTRRRELLRLGTPIDAASGIGQGWSLRDRTRTMRVAADPNSGPRDLALPGHVHPAWIDEQAGHAAAAALELARLTARAPAVALCAVAGRDGELASLSAARAAPGLGGLPHASSAELHSLAVQRRTAELAVSARLPTRLGEFTAVGFGPAEDGPVTIVLIHGDPASREQPLVHLHVACLFGDTFGSLLCDCRERLDASITAMLAEGAGVIVYAKPDSTAPLICARDQAIDAPLTAGLLRAAGVSAFRLTRSASGLAAELSRYGLIAGGETD